MSTTQRSYRRNEDNPHSSSRHRSPSRHYHRSKSPPPPRRRHDNNPPLPPQSTTKQHPPPPSKKRNNHTRKQNNTNPHNSNSNSVTDSPAMSKKRRKLEYSSPGPPPLTIQTTTILDGQPVPELDQSNPVHARRIQQRRRMIMFGKNTVGYDEYIKQVPKHKRKVRSMDHPSTPDYKADIPTKRWQGLVKAWRKALHTFDPPDLQTPKTPPPAPLPLTPPPQSTQDQEIAAARSKNLQVDFSSPAPVLHPLGWNDADAFDVLEEEEQYQQMITAAEEGEDEVVKRCDWGGDVDSDDDLL